MRELEALSSELQKERELRERMLNCVQDVVYVLDAQENKLTFISSEIALLLGYPRKNIQAWKDDLFPRLMHPEDLALLPIFHARLANIRDGETLDFQFRMRDAKGEFRWLRSREVILERSDEGEPARVLGIAEDFTSRRREEDHLREMALIDELTGLRNRRGFVAISEQYARIALRQGQQFAVAATLEKTFRSSDIRCRFGGDEFAALAVDTAEQGSEILTSRIRRNIEEWNAASSRPYRIEFSIGNAIFNPAKNEGARAGTSPFEAALRAADQAMYRDKNARRSQRAG